MKVLYFIVFTLLLNCSHTIETFKKPIYLKHLQKESFKDKVEIKFNDDTKENLIFTDLTEDSVTLIYTDMKDEDPVLKRYSLSEIEYIKIPNSEYNSLAGFSAGFVIGFAAQFVDPNGNIGLGIFYGMICGTIGGFISGISDSYIIYNLKK